jgi:hypothetical protein
MAISPEEDKIRRSNATLSQNAAFAEEWTTPKLTGVNSKQAEREMTKS